MTDVEEKLENLIEEFENFQILEKRKKANSVDLFYCKKKENGIERYKPPLELWEFMKRHAERIEKFEMEKGSTIELLRLDSLVWRVCKKMGESRCDRTMLKRNCFEKVVKRYRKAKEKQGNVLSLTREDLHVMALGKNYKDDLVRIFELLVPYASEIDCSVESAAAGLMFYDDEFAEKYDKLSEKILEIGEDAELFERVWDELSG